MTAFTVVIMTKNEATTISGCIKSCRAFFQAVIVADTGSTDNTVAIAEANGAIVYKVKWEGYGKTRNTIANLCKTDWILVIDADEKPTPMLINSISNLSQTILAKNPRIVYGFKRMSFLGKKPIHFGEWGRDRVYRLYNKKFHQWDDVLVHENIIATNNERKIIKGILWHHTMKNVEQLIEKQKKYALLSAEKYFISNKKVGIIKLYLAPFFSFIQNYLFRLGFLDGEEGFIIAKYNMLYVYWKYKALKQKYLQH